MKIKLIIDKKDKRRLYIFVNDYDITSYIFPESQPKHVLNVKPLPGEVSRKIKKDNKDYLVIVVKSEFTQDDYLELSEKDASKLIERE